MPCTGVLSDARAGAEVKADQENKRARKDVWMEHGVEVGAHDSVLRMNCLLRSTSFESYTWRSVPVFEMLGCVWLAV